MDEDIKSLLLAEDGTRKVIELLLGKLESKEKQLQEISAERVALIMAGINNVDLSWVASQESVDKIQEEVTEMKSMVSSIDNKIDKLLGNNTPDEKDPTTDPEEPTEPEEPGNTDDEKFVVPDDDGSIVRIISVDPNVMTVTQNAGLNIGDPVGQISTNGVANSNMPSRYSKLNLTVNVYSAENKTLIHQDSGSIIGNAQTGSILNKYTGLQDYIIPERIVIMISAMYVDESGNPL